MRLAPAALDHLVLATPDLARTAAWVAEHTGVWPSAGGQHVGLGTRNMLCSLSSTSYLEIVGPDPDQLDITPARPFGVDDLTAPALVGWAIGVPDMEAALAATRAAGYDPGASAAMQRRRPDDVLLSWQLTFCGSKTIPFLIDWGASPHPAETAAPGLVLAELRARHPDPIVLSAALEALGVTMGVEHGDESLVVEIRGPSGSVQFG
ncbi:MAG: VOC family protein [Ilumatobacteraceae bacterium]